MRSRSVLAAAAAAAAATVALGAGVVALHRPETQTAVTAASTSSCAPYAAITAGKYWINNNTWGSNAGKGSQCIARTRFSGGTLGWTTTYNWTGQYNAVKSYASVVLGWHWGLKRSGTGLPTKLQAGKNIKTGWTFTPAKSGTFNVSYDLWLHTTASPTYNSTPTDEVMVWLYRSGGAGPLGTKVATVTIANTKWYLYEGTTSWKVYSFVRAANTTKATLNLKAFLTYLRTHRGLSGTKYLSGVEAGTEVFTGAGKLTTTSYSAGVS